DGQQRRYVSLVRSSAEVLSALINDVLDISKIEAGKLELEALEFNVRDLVRDLVELMEQPASAKGLAIATEIAAGTPGTVRGDPTRLRQILMNLLSNAIKFTEK